MEFALAAFSAALVPVMQKLTLVTSKLSGKSSADATFIRNELNLLKGWFTDESFRDRYNASHTWRVSSKLLQSLAEDIGNCIDRFDAKMMPPQQFAEEIVQLKKRSQDTHEQIKTYLSISVQGQQVPLAGNVPKGLQTLQDSNKNQHDPVDLNSLLYFCMFPPHLPARSNPLIRIWMAEGIVQTEEVAFNYLKTLIKFNVINNVLESNNGKVKRCIPPEEILGYLSHLSRSESFMLLCDDMAQLQTECPRGLSIHPKGNAISYLNLPEDLSHLRTLVVFPAGGNLPGDEAILDFTRYGLLRVLDVKKCAHLDLGEKHLLAICDLWLLKYLSFGSSINRVPRKIGNLLQLETLDLRGCERVTVYEEVILLPRLKHLLGKFQLSRSDVTLIPGLGSGLGWTMTRLQKVVGEKCRLETLAGFVVNNRKGFAQLMSHIKRLRKTEICCEPNASEKNMEDLASAITIFIRKGVDMPKPARSLKLDVSTFSKELSQKFLHSIQPNGGSLFSFKLNAKLANFPQFITQLSGIEELCLSSTTLDGDAMMTGLSMLTILKYLKLVEDNLGPLTIKPQQLPALERLCLVGGHSLCDITIQDRALPCLISLHIRCKSLGDLPGINISSITNLKEVALLSEVSKATKDAWETAAKCHPNAPRFWPIKNP